MSQRKSRIIVSLTSYNRRLKNLHLVIDSILNQSLKPDKIVLVLYDNDIKYISLEIKKLIDNNIIELIVCDLDLKGHKKYFYTMLKYKNDIIITIDDDVIYSKDTIQTLYNAYLKHKNCICGRRVHRIIKGKRYNDWEHECTSIITPSMDLFCTGVGGVLYPPNILNIDKVSIDDIYECINADDVFLKHLQLKNGVNVVWAVNDKPHPKMIYKSLFDNMFSLSYKNVLKGENDNYIKKFNVYEE